MRECRVLNTFSSEPRLSVFYCPTNARWYFFNSKISIKVPRGDINAITLYWKWTVNESLHFIRVNSTRVKASEKKENYYKIIIGIALQIRRFRDHGMMTIIKIIVIMWIWSVVCITIYTHFNKYHVDKSLFGKWLDFSFFFLIMKYCFKR